LKSEKKTKNTYSRTLTQGHSRSLPRDALVQSAVLRLHVVCLSVRLSVCDVGGSGSHRLGWKSWKLIARSIRSTSSLFVAQRSSTYYQGNMGKFGGDEVGWGKVACWSTKAVISLKRIQIEEKLQWIAYWKSLTLFRTVPFSTPYGLPFAWIGGSQPHPKTAIAIISRTVKARDFKFGRCIHKVHPNTSP